MEASSTRYVFGPGVCDDCGRQPGEQHSTTCHYYPAPYTREQWDFVKSVRSNRKPLPPNPEENKP